MKLGEFIQAFSHNNVIRLVYRNEGGTQLVHNSWNDVSMDHEILKGTGKNRHFINNEVLGVVGIYFSPVHQPVENSNNLYPEAVNIIIERLENQPTVVDSMGDIVRSHHSI